MQEKWDKTLQMCCRERKIEEFRMKQVGPMRVIPKTRFYDNESRAAQRSGIGYNGKERIRFPIQANGSWTAAS